LFRAQRNLYIAGFALFLWLVIRRLISLIQKEAQLIASADASLKQAKNASQAAEAMMGSGGIGIVNPDAKKFQSEIEKLKKDLKQAELDRDTMRKQTESLQKEYGRIADELAQSQGKVNKKDAWMEWLRFMVLLTKKYYSTQFVVNFINDEKSFFNG